MIIIENLGKTYTKKKKREKQESVIVKNINLSISDSEVIALLGHNGSGKSTLIKCIVGVLKPTTGQVVIDGLNSFKHRKKLIENIGVVFNQKPSFIVDLSVQDNLNYFKAIYNLSDDEVKHSLDIIDGFLDIKDLYVKQYRKLSFGERVKCEITSVLLHNPKYIILDEPTIGLDYNAKKGLYNLLKYYKEKFKSTIIITTHEVDYIEGICDRAVILSKGEIRYCGNPQLISEAMSNKIKLTVEFERIIDIKAANLILDKSETFDKEKNIFAYNLTDGNEKDNFIKSVASAFSITNISVNTASLRGVLEDVLKEIEKNNKSFA